MGAHAVQHAANTRLAKIAMVVRRGAAESMYSLYGRQITAREGDDAKSAQKAKTSVIPRNQYCDTPEV